MKGSALTQKVEALIAPMLESMGFDLVIVRLIERNKSRTLQVMAEPHDRDTMTVDDCAEISRAVSAVLDVEDPITGAYDLEVSSPGIDRPLVKRDDFERFAGYEAKIETLLPMDGQRRFKGTLAGVEGNNVKFLTEQKKDVSIDYENIDSAKLVLTDELVREFLKGQKKKPT